MWVPSQDQFSATPRQMRRAANPTDTPPRGLDGLLEGVASKEANSPPLCLSTTAGGVHCATTTLWYWRRASVVYPDVPVLAVPSRHRPARTAGHNRTKRSQTAPQTTNKHIMELARNRQVGGSNPPSGSRSEHLVERPEQDSILPYDGTASCSRTLSKTPGARSAGKS